MKNATIQSKTGRTYALTIAFSALMLAAPCARAVPYSLADSVAIGANGPVTSAFRLNPTTVEVSFSDNRTMTFDFYGDNIFRLFQDNRGGIIRAPQASPEAIILVDNPRKSLSSLDISQNADRVVIRTKAIEVDIDKATSLMTVRDMRRGKVVLQETEPILFEKNKVYLSFKENPGEYFFGGGMQNGRFSHKGKVISIENQNSWTDGGVASPNPFYWSTEGYGVMFHTFKKGKYDFGANTPSTVRLHHDTDYLDAFIMVSETPAELLSDFYQLTGNPVLLPKFGFYEGHLNAYNRDFWKEDEKGILFEDGKKYKESQKDNGGIKESLNGEKGNYQFSARAVIDRYKQHDMPLGWLLPNDGYGAGYGQTETLDGNVANLKSLTDYAHKNGVEIGLWTQSDLHPKPEVSALLQRDIVKEVRDAGVRVLKTDVAWVGAGYSFGLNGITDVAHIMSYYGNDARPFIISLDGWAGTQRYAGIWSGDQSGGNWEYIRFHIPTYIGSGLSGQPNVGSDMDGIFGGKNPIVNIRDFQWKTFTPMELNMDGWGANEKYPHALGEPATSINRMYLKMKSELLPYAYSIAKESVDGLPMIRAMFLDTPNRYTLGKSTQYQYLYGRDFLVAPVYQATASDTLGNDIRNGIYLPEGEWIDYLSGESYAGGRIINNFETPIWKLPIFVRRGAIIPMANPNNNVGEIDANLRIYEIYPSQYSSFVHYDDDGVSEQYRRGVSTTTLIEQSLSPKNRLKITIHPTEGNFDGFVASKATELIINTTSEPRNVTAKVGKNKIKLSKATSKAQFDGSTNVYFYDAAPDMNRFATKGSEFERVKIIKNPQFLVKLAPADITLASLDVEMEDYEYAPANKLLLSSGSLSAPAAMVADTNATAYTLTPTWTAVNNADYYEIELDSMIYSTIRETSLLFDNLIPKTDYAFKIRAVNRDGASEWASFSAATKDNPLLWAIRGASAVLSVADQGDMEVNKLFDFDESNTWHTAWGSKAVPFEMVINLGTINQLDKFEYMPRSGGGNGILMKGQVYYSHDNENWTEAGAFDWKKSDEVKVFEFKEKPQAGYIKLSVTEAVGNYGSGRELYIFKVSGTESYRPGDINNDRLIDRNDLTSYMNYTGLRLGDADFEGYISNGDINKNNLIDAYDISVLATQLDGGIETGKQDSIAGVLSISVPKQSYKAGETIEVTVSGKGLNDVNALSFAMPYDPQSYEYLGTESVNTKKMDNMTYDRLHTNGVKALYPTFVNIGEQPVVSEDGKLFILKLKARKDLRFDLKMQDGILVGKSLKTAKF